MKGLTIIPPSTHLISSRHLIPSHTQPNHRATLPPHQGQFLSSPSLPFQVDRPSTEPRADPHWMLCQKDFCAPTQLTSSLLSLPPSPSPLSRRCISCNLACPPGAERCEECGGRQTLNRRESSTLGAMSTLALFILPNIGAFSHPPPKLPSTAQESSSSQGE